jgi:hypothetical protein
LQQKEKAHSFLLSVRHSGGHVQSGTRRVAQKIRGNHSVRYGARHPIAIKSQRSGCCA